MANARTTGIVIALLLLIGLPAYAQFTTADTLKAVVPGLVYKEFSRTIAGGNLWRVTDPNATFVGDPLNSPSTFLPNPVLSLTVGDLQGAIKAVAVIDCWGGHIGTVNKRFRLNGNNWINIPSIANTPGNPECYTHQYSVEVEVPLADLVQGNNALEGTSGGQACFGWGWGQWGWYGIVLRIYYDPGQKTPPSGAITSPLPGATIGENPTLEAAASSVAGISRVDFVGYYDDFDVDGDGVFLDWQQSYHRLDTDNVMTLRNHMGSAYGAPYNVVWENGWIPDQAAGEIKIVARIQDVNGLWIVSDQVTGLTLDRPGLSVKSYKPTNVPTNYWVRIGQTKSSNFTIPAGDELVLAESARMQVATWNGINGAAEPGQDHWTKVNGTITAAFGEDHFYSYDTVNIPVGVLQSGTNTVSFYSATSHHGAEILWPGPAMTVRYVDYSNVAALIVSQPADGIAIVDSTATFSVIAGGAEPISYQWQRNGVDIPGADGPSYTTPPVSSLDDGDLYRCAVSNFLGGDVSSEATLSVLVPGVRETAGQIVMYGFNEGAGDTIRDIAGFGAPADLVIGDSGTVSWLPGALSVDSPAAIASTGPATKISTAVTATNEVTIEAWLKPANLTQNGPARIISMSTDLGTRNFTVGQGIYGVASDVYDVRLRTTATGFNGTPSLSTPLGDLTTQLTHVVFTRNVAGVTKIYIDGEERASAFAAGDLSNWDPSYLLILANEATGDRPWLGEFHLLAVFDRALPYVDVLRNYVAGPETAGEIHATVFTVQPLGGPVALLALPDGTGHPLSAAQQWNGVIGTPPTIVNATIGVQLSDGLGQPIVGFPAEKITLMAQSGGWSQCPTSGLTADGPTDATGTTTISGTLPVGGHSAPGELLQVRVDDPQWASTTYANGLDGLEYWINSPDVAGDLVVNLTDVAEFAGILAGGIYDFAGDYAWDGVINLTDVTKLSMHYGTGCLPASGTIVAANDRAKVRLNETIGVAFGTPDGLSARPLIPGEQIRAFVTLQGPAAERGVGAFDLHLRFSENLVVHQRQVVGDGLNIGSGEDFVVGWPSARKSAAAQPLALVQLLISVTDREPAYLWLEPSGKSAHDLPTVASNGEIRGARPTSGEVALAVAALNDESFALAAGGLPGARLTLGIAPNPFNPMTEIRFNLPVGGPVDLRIYDTRGQLVTTLRSELMQAGAHEVVWRGTDRSGRAVASGVYFARLQTDSGELLQKMILLK